MSNIIIGVNNLIDGAALSGGSWSGVLPLANLKNRLLSKVARSTNALAASSLVNIDLGSAKSIKALGAIATNISATGATYRVRGSNDNTFATSLFDTGTVSAVTQTPHLIIGIPAGIVARYWRIEITDTANAAGYVQIGRVFIGDGFVPTDNYSLGATRGVVSTTAVVTSIGAVDYFDVQPVRRSTQLSLNWLTHAEAELVQALIADSDIANELLLILDAADTVYRQRNHYLARLRQLSPLQSPYQTINQQAFDFLEIV